MLWKLGGYSSERQWMVCGIWGTALTQRSNPFAGNLGSRGCERPAADGLAPIHGLAD